VSAEVELRMLEGSEFQTVGIAMLKPREAKVMRTRGTDKRFSHFVIIYQIYLKTIYFKVCVTKKQIWLEMDSDIILNKPDLNT